MHWQFWIDVGGTFTDCFARTPEGKLLRHKVLSSGVTKGIAASGSGSRCIVDSVRMDDPPQFWRGYRLRLLDEKGNSLAEATVADFCRLAGSFHLTPALSVEPGLGQAYELI